MGQFWTNRDFDGSTVGLAYVGTVGVTGYKYHILQDFTSDPTSLRVMTAHEMGHNFGAGHDNSGDPISWLLLLESLMIGLLCQNNDK